MRPCPGPCPSWPQTYQDPHCTQDKPSHPSPPTCEPALLPSLISPAPSLTLSSTSILTRPQSLPGLQVCAQAVPSAWNPFPFLFPPLTLQVLAQTLPPPGSPPRIPLQGQVERMQEIRAGRAIRVLGCQLKYPYVPRQESGMTEWAGWRLAVTTQP